MMRLAWVALLGSACVLGGAARPGAPGDVVLQLMAALLVPATLVAALRARVARAAGLRLPICIAGLVLATALLQLLPIHAWMQPTSMSAEFMREVAALVPDVGPLQTPSVDPGATMSALLSTLPALVVFAAACASPDRDRRIASLVLLAAGSVGALTGLLQVAQGPASRLRFTATADPFDAVGFFANRNHFAAFLYVLFLVAVVWAVDAAAKASASPMPRWTEPAVLLPPVACLVVVALLLAAQVLARSRAGLGLTLIALFAAMLIVASAGRTAPRASTRTPARLLAAACVAGMLASIEFASLRAIERFAGDPLAGARTTFARNTVEAALAHHPLGSGLGTFVPIYGLFERPQDALLDAFVNRAHNDLLELWLEAGVPGLLAVGLFLAWLARAALVAWRGPRRDRQPIDVLLARVASVGVALLLVHSLVDYPLRTTALQTVVAFLCALLVPPPAARPSHGARRASPRDFPEAFPPSADARS